MDGNQGFARGWQMGMQMVQAGAQKRRFQQETKLKEQGMEIQKKMQNMAEKLQEEKKQLMSNSFDEHWEQLFVLQKVKRLLR